MGLKARLAIDAVRSMAIPPRIHASARQTRRHGNPKPPRATPGGRHTRPRQRDSKTAWGPVMNNVGGSGLKCFTGSSWKKQVRGISISRLRYLDPDDHLVGIIPMPLVGLLYYACAPCYTIVSDLFLTSLPTTHVYPRLLPHGADLVAARFGCARLRSAVGSCALYELEHGQPPGKILYSIHSTLATHQNSSTPGTLHPTQATLWPRQSLVPRDPSPARRPVLPVVQLRPPRQEELHRAQGGRVGALRPPGRPARPARLHAPCISAAPSSS